MKKVNKKTITIIITIILFLSGISLASAATILISSNGVNYDNTKSGLNSTTVKAAIDELDSKIPTLTGCPTGEKTCTKKTPICKRATTLHTETCQQSSNFCAAVEGNGNTITYGQLGTSGVLTPGDAFDCKVSTTGGYTERFYYVSDYYDTSKKAFNSEVAVLIYNTNTKEGAAVAGTTAGVAYDSNNKNYNGPVTAVTHLPTTSTWNNISLYKNARQILANNNGTETTVSSTSQVLPTAFSYSGKAARLLTYQELYSACYNTTITSTGGLNNCNFLFENTKYSVSSNATYGPSLETPNSPCSFRLEERLVLNASSRNLSYVSANFTGYGVRPTIEVLKSDISY